MARIDAAYDYFLSTYGKELGSRYESHKKSELRDTYNSIIKSNKESPLYKITDTHDVSKYAIDIKEHANAMAVAVSNLTSAGSDISSVLDKRIATSSDESIVGVTYTGNEESSTEDFTIKINKLAKPQVNFGNYLDPSGHSFEEGQYSFDLDIKNSAYEFQFNVNRGDTNLDVQKKVCRLINSSDIGLSSDISTKNGETALFVVSKATGLGENEEQLFNINTNTSWRELNTLGIQTVSEYPSNSSFELNGVEHSSLSNVFTVNKSYELTLKSTSSEPVKVGLMNDTEALADGINQLTDSFNGMLRIGRDYALRHNNSTLYNEFFNVSKRLSTSLAEAGIEVEPYGYLKLNPETLSDAVNSEKRESVFETLNDLRDTVSGLSKRTSINPINYVDKVIVEYKNPSKTLTFPYATSQYSGLLLDYGL